MSEDYDPMLYVHFDGLNPALTDVTMIVVAMNISKFTHNYQPGATNFETRFDLP